MIHSLHKRRNYLQLWQIWIHFNDFVFSVSLGLINLSLPFRSLYEICLVRISFSLQHSTSQKFIRIPHPLLRWFSCSHPDLIHLHLSMSLLSKREKPLMLSLLVKVKVHLHQRWSVKVSWVDLGSYFKTVTWQWVGCQPLRKFVKNFSQIQNSPIPNSVFGLPHTLVPSSQQPSFKPVSKWPTNLQKDLEQIYRYHLSTISIGFLPNRSHIEWWLFHEL